MMTMTTRAESLAAMMIAMMMTMAARGDPAVRFPGPDRFRGLGPRRGLDPLDQLRGPSLSGSRRRGRSPLALLQVEDVAAAAVEEREVTATAVTIVEAVMVAKVTAVTVMAAVAVVAVVAAVAMDLIVTVVMTALRSTDRYFCKDTDFDAWCFVLDFVTICERHPRFGTFVLTEWRS